MNANQVINKVMRRGVNAGIDKVTRGRGDNGPDGQKTARNARKTMKLGRRMGRF